MDKRRYLPLFDTDGKWIDRPDLYLFARMAYADQDDDEIVVQLYDTMRRTDNRREALNLLESDLARRHVARQSRARVLAGTVVLELARIAAVSCGRVSLKAAFRLVATHQLGFDGKRAQVESVRREVEKAFSDYRNTAHLQAALLTAPSADAMECSEVETTRFLSYARGFEILLDEHLTGDRTKWHPWRIPERFPATPVIDLPALDEHERAILNAV